MIKNENRGHDFFEDKIIDASGFNKITGVPGVSAELGREWSLGVLGELPIWQHFNGVQFVNRYAITGTVSKQFEFHKKKKTS